MADNFASISNCAPSLKRRFLNNISPLIEQHVLFSAVEIVKNKRKSATNQQVLKRHKMWVMK